MPTTYQYVRNFLALALLLTLGASLYQPSALAQTSGPTVTTDQSDYPPGGTVYITGSGFAPGETVTNQVLHIPDIADNVTSPAHQPWTVTADENGNFSTTWYVPLDQDEAGATLQLTATGKTSGLTAQTTFTDAGQCKGATVTDPVSATRCPGDSVTFSVTATCGAAGGCALTYQWQKGGLDITGATGTSYTILSVTATDAGVYDVMVTEDDGGGCTPKQTKSQNATLTVNTSTSITGQPSSTTVCSGLPATFSVTATGTSLNYQWQRKY